MLLNPPAGAAGWVVARIASTAVYPLTFGSGKRLFPDGTGVPAAFRPTQPPKGFPSGATWLVYERAGQPVTGVDLGEA